MRCFLMIRWVAAAVDDENEGMPYSIMDSSGATMTTAAGSYERRTNSQMV